jgi:hypothetical protein
VLLGPALVAFGLAKKPRTATARIKARMTYRS